MKADALEYGPTPTSPRWVLTALASTQDTELQDVLEEEDIALGWLLSQAAGSPSTSQG